MIGQAKSATARYAMLLCTATALALATYMGVNLLRDRRRAAAAVVVGA